MLFEIELSLLPYSIAITRMIADQIVFEKSIDFDYIYRIYSLVKRTIFYEKIWLFDQNLLKTRGASYKRVFWRSEKQLFHVFFIINANLK